MNNIQTRLRIMTLFTGFTLLPNLGGQPFSPLDQSPYAGIFEYLSQGGLSAEESQQRLVALQGRVDQGEDVLATLKGKHEWAYLSSADESAQPFTIFIPHDPAPKDGWSLIVDLHGGGGTHQRKYGRVLPKTVVVCPLGHGKNARYRGLSEHDVSEVIAYVSEHWPINCQRIALRGFSLGGAGSFTLASRHPDWFNAVQPLAGWGISGYPENLACVRLWAYTSRDDTAIHVLCQSALKAIATEGGEPAHLSANGFGHGFPGDFGDALETWITKDVPRRFPETFQYTAEDEAGTGAWGINVTVCGDYPWLPSFQFERDEISVRIKTDNIQSIRLRPTLWGHDPALDCRVSIDGGGDLVLPAGDGGVFQASLQEGVWRLGQTGTLEGRPHFPGGFDALMHGEPLTVVYGTASVSTKTNEDMKKLARVMAKLPSANITGQPERMFGRFPVMSDQEYIDVDKSAGNLVIIGSAEENLVASEVAASMTAVASNQQVQAGELRWSMDNATAGILGRNPHNLDQLVYWLISNGDGAYSRENLPFKLLGFDSRVNICPDLLITANDKERLIAARRLNGKWEWIEPLHEQNTLKDNSRLSLGELRAEAARSASGSDFGYAVVSEPEKGFRVSPESTLGVTKLEDVACLYDGDRILVMELTGGDISKLDAEKSLELAFVGLSTGEIEHDRRYRVAGIAREAWAILRVCNDPDLPVHLTTIDMGQAMREQPREE